MSRKRKSPFLRSIASKLKTVSKFAEAIDDVNPQTVPTCYAYIVYATLEAISHEIKEKLSEVSNA